MPCLNEARTLAKCIQQAKAFLLEHGVSGEVLIADNGSTDGSVGIALNLGARVIGVEQRGYGAALQAGISAARGRYIAMADSDCSYNFGGLAPFLEALRRGQQLVVGNRFKGGIEPGAMPLLHRYLGNPVLSFVGRRFFGGPLSDFHCGLRAFDRQAVLDLGLITPGMEFASEMIVKALQSGLRISEVPTTLAPDERGRPPHLNTWRDGWRHLRFLFLFAPRWLFLYPGALLLLLGILQFSAAFAPVGWIDGAWPRGVHAELFAAAACVIGWQTMLLALGVIYARHGAGLETNSRSERLILRWIQGASLVLGGVLMLFAGLLICIELPIEWQRAGFGPLDPQKTMQILIPGIALTIGGAQALLAKLYLATLRSAFESSGRLRRNEQKAIGWRELEL